MHRIKTASIFAQDSTLSPFCNNTNGSALREARRESVSLSPLKQMRFHPPTNAREPLIMILEINAPLGRLSPSKRTKIVQTGENGPPFDPKDSAESEMSPRRAFSQRSLT